MKKKNRENAESENEDDLFAFRDLTTLGKYNTYRASIVNYCQTPTELTLILYLIYVYNFDFPVENYKL